MRWSALFLLLIPASAVGHGGQPAVAYLNEPAGVDNVVDDSFTFTWIDADRPIPTGTATVDFFYMRERVSAFIAGTIPPWLDENVVVRGLLEKDLTNSYTWDTSSVPAGTYQLWSRVAEPPEEIASPQLILFSPGAEPVQHPGDQE